MHERAPETRATPTAGRDWPFDLSRYMGASLTMIDRHYRHLAKDGRQQTIDLLNAHTDADVHAVDAR